MKELGCDENDGAVENGPPYCPAPSGNSGIASSAPASGETGLASFLTGDTLATTPGSLVLQWITQTS
jgi:hypothetical protein